MGVSRRVPKRLPTSQTVWVQWFVGKSGAYVHGLVMPHTYFWPTIKVGKVGEEENVQSSQLQMQ